MTRLKRLKAMIDQLGVDLEHTGAGEDLAPYLSGMTPIPVWALVTNTRNHVYIYLYPYIAAAEAHALNIIDDDIFPEAPRYLTNLDTGVRIKPTITVKFDQPQPVKTTTNF